MKIDDLSREEAIIQLKSFRNGLWRLAHSKDPLVSAPAIAIIQGLGVYGPNGEMPSTA